MMFPSNNKAKPNDEIVIFAGDFLLSLLEKSGYYQLLVLIALNPQTNMFTPILYIFATSKTEEIYFHSFYWIKMLLDKKKIQNGIKIMMLDFEMAIHKACKEVFPSIIILGCYFHYVKYNFGNYFSFIF